MDIVLNEIGTLGHDYSTLIPWYADLKNPGLACDFNVGVYHSDSQSADLTRDINEISQKYKQRELMPQFVLMDDTGTIWASRIAGRTQQIHARLPPEEPSPVSTAIGCNTIPIDGELASRDLDAYQKRQALEDIARTYIHKQLDEYDRSINRTEVAVLFKTVNDALAQLISKDARALVEIEWRDLERLLAHVLSGIGYNVTLTPASKDGGKDLIVECLLPSGKRSYFIEVKHWRSQQNVGASLIKDFYKVVIREKAHGGLFLSTYGFTDNLMEQLTEVEHRKIRLGTEHKIVALCKSYVRSKSGVILPSTELPSFLLSDTE